MARIYKTYTRTGRRAKLGPDSRNEIRGRVVETFGHGDEIWFNIYSEADGCSYMLRLTVDEVANAATGGVIDKICENIQALGDWTPPAEQRESA